MDRSGQCSGAIKALAEDLKAQAKARSYGFCGPSVPDESQKDQTQHCIEKWAEELEELSESMSQSALETDAQGAAIYHQVEAITAKARAAGILPSASLVHEIAHACVMVSGAHNGNDV